MQVGCEAIFTLLVLFTINSVFCVLLINEMLRVSAQVLWDV